MFATASAIATNASPGPDPSWEIKLLQTKMLAVFFLNTEIVLVIGVLLNTTGYNSRSLLYLVEISSCHVFSVTDYAENDETSQYRCRAVHHGDDYTAREIFFGIAEFKIFLAEFDMAQESGTNLTKNISNTLT